MKPSLNTMSKCIFSIPQFSEWQCLSISLYAEGASFTLVLAVYLPLL